jgi:hypothetical protein|tara:strand:+ start:320 stop:442 length:123 start_codon:yes stop_codon:yes gene_type:complete
MAALCKRDGFYRKAGAVGEETRKLGDVLKGAEDEAAELAG